MKHLQTKLIIYDGACPLCTQLHSLMLRRNILPAEKMKSYYDLDALQQSQINQNRFRNEMALIDTRGGATIYGPEALVYIFAGKWTFARGLFAIPGMMPLLRFVYRVIGANRYQIATPRSKMLPCTCAPDRPLSLRATYHAWNLFWAVLITALFGAGLAGYFPELTAIEGAKQMLLIAGSGWLIQILLSLIFLKTGRDYIDHLSTIMRKGVMILVPATLLMLIAGPVLWWIPALSVVASSAIMLRQHILRVRLLGLSQNWTRYWFLALQSTAIFWLTFFSSIH